MCLKNYSRWIRWKRTSRLKCEEDFSQATKLLANATCELEKWVPFTKELSIIVAGNKHGYQSFPVSENIHRKNILHESIVPARISENVQQKQRNWRNTLLRN